MDAITSITLERLAVVRFSGFETEDEMAQAVLDFIEQLCSDLLADKALTTEQTHGVRRAMHHVPATWRAFATLLEPMPPELRANYVYILAKMMDDLLSLASIASGGADGKSFSRSFGADGGKAGAKTRQKKADADWKIETRKLIRAIVQEDPNRSQDTIVSEVIWRGIKGKLPGPKSIKSLVAEMDADGSIVRKKRR